MTDDNLILDSARRLLRESADIQDVLSARDDGWRERLWQGVRETGLDVAAVPESLGGADVGLSDAFGILRAAGESALAAPLAETILAGWMLGAAGIAPPPGPTAFGPTSFADAPTLDGDGMLRGSLARLPFARDCAQAALLVGGAGGLQVVLVDLGEAVIEPRENLAFDPVDRVTFDGSRVVASAPAPAAFTPETSLLIGAAARSLQIAGALERMLALATDYVGQRKAFGRTLSKFQAVQHGLARLAGETAVALSAAMSAADALATGLGEGRGFGDPELALEIMSAKIRTASAAEAGAAIAHQVFGAIGVTREHVLHRLTLRALAWRDDFGNESEWSAALGRLVCGRGAAALWPLLATR